LIIQVKDSLSGESSGDTAYRIRSIQSALGIEKSEFPELEGIGTSDGEMTDEEIQLRREEQEDAGDWEFEKPEESYTEEWSGRISNYVERSGS